MADGEILTQGPQGLLPISESIDPSLLRVQGSQPWRDSFDRAMGLGMGFGPGAIRGWHGTQAAPFTQFSNEAIGTGEGAQSYGMGHYIAGHPGVAESYAGEEGSLLEVHIRPEHNEFLDWDLPFGQQELGVQEKLKMLEKNLGTDLTSSLTAKPGQIAKGRDFYNALSDHIYNRGVPEWLAGAAGEAGDASRLQASQMLHDVGIPGNRYLDQFSRAAPEDLSKAQFQVDSLQRSYNSLPTGTTRWLDTGRMLDAAKSDLDRIKNLIDNPTHNYVVFHPSNLEIRSRDGISLIPVDGDPFAPTR